MKQLHHAQEEFVTNLLDALNKKTVPWRASWDQGIYKPYNASSEATYQGMNQLNLWMLSVSRGYDDPRWMTFKQAKEKGFRIKKGSIGTSISSYILRHTVTKKYVTFDAYNELTEEEQKLVKPFYKTYKVFHASQIDGIQALEEPHLTFKHEKAEIFCNELLEQLNIEVEFGGGRAAYNIDTDRIYMPNKNSFLSEEDYYATLLHEIGHSTFKEHRMNRNIDPSNKKEYAMEELRVELASVFLSMDLGFHLSQDHVLQHEAYLASWHQEIQDKPGIIFEAIHDAKQIQTYLLEQGKYQELAKEEQKLKVEVPAKIMERRFIDMDGVLNKFNNQLPSLDVLYEEGYFANLEPHESVVASIRALIAKNPEQIYILSAALESPYAIKEKTSWLNQYLPELKQEQMIFTEYGKNKVDYIPGGVTKHDILLDDYTTNLTQWHEAGGTGIKLLNGINDTNGTWKGTRIDFDHIQDLDNVIKKLMVSSAELDTKEVQKKDVDLQVMKDSISIADYARDALGLGLVKEGRGLLRLEQHDSCKIYPNNTFYRFSSDVGGSIIDFIKHFEDVDTREAIHKMKSYYQEFSPNIQFDSASQIVKPRDDIKGLVMPEKADTNKHIYAYLTKTRGIQPSIVNDLIDRKLLYEDVQRNCVFVGKHNDTIQYANLRSTGQSSKFKQDAKGSIKEVGIYIDNKSNILVVNEAIIDSMSYMSLADNPKNYNYLAVNGAANCNKALRFHMLKREESNRINHIVLALDNDEAGEKNMDKTLKYIKCNFPEIDVSIHLPNGKDFNEQLVNERQLMNDFAPSKNNKLEMV